ncbi:DUF3775 domain-containing protein [Clostridium sp. MSJ-8]|uniref:DUF3775 domain-containing protein n=1 Tax=Clostridium sp. MSJ-8 TaxID=2841510 RepID=UPI001C0EAA5F|nr:DUF3775 domain-containing protein [Clostridium sp. MSJ-8]MBU5487013.1 DUF3775 domain-containing protein [Clostridium sp. MSJ-8]
MLENYATQIQKTIELAMEIETCRNKIDPSSIPKQISDFEKFEKTEAVKILNSHIDKLEKYLKTLSLEELKVIKVVMYIGRDYKNNNLPPVKKYEIERKYWDKKGCKSKDLEIQTLLEKRPLLKYLQSGCELLQINLN